MESDISIWANGDFSIRRHILCRRRLGKSRFGPFRNVTRVGIDEPPFLWLGLSCWLERAAREAFRSRNAPSGRYHDAELLATLADQCRQVVLARLDLAAWELPAASESRGREPSRGQQPPAVEDGCGDHDDCHGEHCRRRRDTNPSQSDCIRPGKQGL